MNLRVPFLSLAVLAAGCGGSSSAPPSTAKQSITDSSIRTLYKGLLKVRAEDPSFVVSEDAALRLLARVGDRRGQSANLILRKLTSATVSRDEKIALVQAGMTPTEKADLVEIVDARELPFAPEAEAMIEAVLARGLRGPDDVTAPITVTDDQSQGLVGKAQAGDAIEAINLSAIATLRLHVDDTTEIATADASGAFAGTLTGEQAIKAGDLIRVRARHSNGSRTDFISFKAQGLGVDVSNAQVAAFRIGLSTQGGGLVAVTNINDGREISEPGAQLQFTNQSTGEKTVFTINNQGTFNAGALVKGAPGDSFVLSVTDGVNNKDFATPLPISPLVVPASGAVTDLVADPSPLATDVDGSGNSRFAKLRFSGPLFNGAFLYTDPQQGQIGDCYLPSAIAALGVNHAAEVQNAVVDNTDGTYTVHFKTRDWANNNGAGYKDAPVVVDGDLYVRSWGGPVYGASVGDSSATGMKLIFPLIEKAYATWKGSYEQVGNGGLSNDLFEAILGRRGRYLMFGDGNEDAAWQLIVQNLDKRLPMSAGTYGDSEEARYVNTGVYADHSYSVIGYSAATRKVTLRNPWGESEPAGNGPNDGVFELDMKTFTHLYNSLMTSAEQ